MYKLIEYNDNYSETTGNLWQWLKDELKNLITGSNSFKFKARENKMVL